MTLQEIVTMTTATIGIVIGIVSLTVSIRAIQISRDSLAQTKSNKRLAMYQDLLDKFMVHNWKLFEHKVSPQLPGTASLTDEEWKVRILIFDHINFLFYVYLHAADSQEEVLGAGDLQGWKRWASAWLKEIQQNPHYEAHFKLIIKGADLYPDDFLVWLNGNIFDDKLKPYFSDEMVARHYRANMPERDK